MLDKINFRQATLPNFEEVIGRKEWVLWGQKNDLPQEFINKFEYSPLFRACVLSKTDGVNGQKLIAEDPKDDLRLMMANPNESVYDVFKKVSLDYILTGNFFLNVIWKEDRDLGISEIYHVDSSTVRLGRKDDYGRITEAYVSADWTNTRKYPSVEYPMFSIDNDKPSQIYHFSTYTPGSQYYGLPEWIGAWNSINLETETRNYWLSNIQNGLNPSLFISLNNGQGTAEEREEVYSQLKDMYEGSDRAGGLMVSWNDSKDNAPEITPINPNGTDTAWTVVSEFIQQDILSSMKISSPMILGIKTPGQLGGRDEIKTAADHFLKTVVVPIQKILLGQFERILFMRDQKVIKLDIVQNELISED